VKQIATDGEALFGLDVSNFTRVDFYVNDGLKSVATVVEAVSLIERSKALCSRIGLRLHTFHSNSNEVLKSRR
jgi:limonene-1,2-epoxide hydrolase